MSSILEKARTDLDHARGTARKHAMEYQSAMRKVRAAEDRVRKLEFAKMEADMIASVLRERAVRARG